MSLPFVVVVVHGQGVKVVVEVVVHQQTRPNLVRPSADWNSPGVLVAPG